MAKKAKFTKVEKIVKGLSDERRQLAEDVLKRLVFTSNTLDELQKRIETEGAVIRTTNGNGFEVVSEHPAHKAYVALIGKYNPLCKTLAELITETTAEKDDSLMNFLRRDGK